MKGKKMVTGLSEEDLGVTWNSSNAELPSNYGFLGVEPIINVDPVLYVISEAIDTTWAVLKDGFNFLTSPACCGIIALSLTIPFPIIVGFMSQSG